MATTVYPPALTQTLDILARIRAAESQGMFPRAILLGVEAHRKFVEWAQSRATVETPGSSLAELNGLPVYCVTYLAPNEWALEVR